MTDKKIIVIALILAVLVIGGGWYYSTHSPGTASISEQSGSPTPLASATEPGIIFGNPSAPVTMEEYTNFLCPACMNFATQTFGKIKDDYIATGKVKIVFYIFPPLELSKAGLCADEQGKFIEYHDYVFSHQSQITDEAVLQDFAVNAGLDGNAFATCYASTKFDDKIQKWIDEGQARGVDSTPTFFINGQKFIGAQPYEEFQKLIDQKLNQ
jgi:protein-disulfide isomerase